MAEHRYRCLACWWKPYTGQPTEHLPPELITALNRHLDEFEPIIGTWNYTVGDANYRVAFRRFAAGFFSCHSVDCDLSLFGADVRLPQEKVCMILNCLVESNSVQGTARLCDVEKRTVLNLLTLAGEACGRLFTERVRNVNVDQLQADEIWTFCRVKQGHLRPDHDERITGDAYTYSGLDKVSKLVVDQQSTDDFISKVRWATSAKRFEMCTDGFSPYIYAIDAGLHDRMDYSQVVKVYSKQEEGRERYSPGSFVSMEKAAILGDPICPRQVHPTLGERTARFRQWCKRLTRLTYVFSKKWTI